MKKLAIISSYNESCGNATYTEALRKEFAKHYDVTIIGLNVSLLNKEHPTMIALGNEHIKEIAEKLAGFDYINIQFEAGLFGRKTTLIYKRIKQLINAAPKLILTLHRYDYKSIARQKNNLKILFRFKIRKFLQEAALTLYRNRFAKLYEKVIIACKKSGAAIIVHTKRDRDLIAKRYKYNSVYDFPLTFLSKSEIEHYTNKVAKTDFLQRYNLNKNNTTIGIFGYISKYKGHHTAIKAIQYLPANYVLLIFGSQHPMSITENQNINIYIKALMKIVEKTPNLKDRVRFCGSLNDEDFINALMSCDYTVLPYLEVNQGGSGIASLTLETRAKAIFSLNLAFIELAKYAVDAYKTFSIGNYLELADAIKTYTADKYSTGLENYNNIYNIHSNIEFHKEIFEN